MKTTIIGIDPGVIHTGCVALTFDDSARTIDIDYEVVNGVDVSDVCDWVNQFPLGPLFVEDYNPSNYAREDKKMSEALGRLKMVYPPSDDPIVKYIDNAGINTMIPVLVQKCFGIYKFPITTHHNDLNSAGKIALLGMLQDKGPVLRELVSRVVKDELWGPGHAWSVTQHG